MHAGTQMVDHTLADGTPVISRPTSTMVITQLRSNLDQTQKMAEMYREQVLLLFGGVLCEDVTIYHTKTHTH